MINELRYGKLYWNIDKKEYLEFGNPGEAQEWGMEHYKNWGDRYKQIMKMSSKVMKGNLCDMPIEGYCGSLYHGINEFLRYGRDSEYHRYRELADILSIVLCSAPRIPDNIVVYRIVSDEFVNMLVENNKRRSCIKEKGFMSTSLLKNIGNVEEAYARQNNMLKIFVPKDTIGVYVNSVTRRYEEELLLFPNMYLRMLSYPYKDVETGKMMLECQLMRYD